jgi:hypothetical protein
VYSPNLILSTESELFALRYPDARYFSLSPEQPAPPKTPVPDAPRFPGAPLGVAAAEQRYLPDALDDLMSGKSPTGYPTWRCHTRRHTTLVTMWPAPSKGPLRRSRPRMRNDCLRCTKEVPVPRGRSPTYKRRGLSKMLPGSVPVRARYPSNKPIRY